MNSTFVEVPLVCHTDTPTRAVDYIDVQVERQHPRLILRYVIGCNTAAIRVPPNQKPCRTKNLWQSTCCELFIRGDGKAYQEFNFSPSGQWSADEFDDYRLGMSPLGLDEPPRIIFCDEPLNNLLLIIPSLLEHRRQELRIGISAVIEELDGTKSLWALSHPPGKPDFHHADCFALTLPALAEG